MTADSAPLTWWQGKTWPLCWTQKPKPEVKLSLHRLLILQSTLKKMDVPCMKHQNAKHNFSKHIPFNCAFFHNYCILTNHLLSVHSTAQKNWIQLLKKVLSKPASEQSWLTRGMSRVTPATTSLRKAYERRALPTQGSESITREATHGALHIFPSFLVSSCSCHSFSSSHSCVSLFLQCCINIRSVPSLYHILR